MFIRRHVSIVQLGPDQFSFLDAAGHLMADCTPLADYRRWTQAPWHYTPQALDPQYVYPSFVLAWQALQAFDPALAATPVVRNYPAPDTAGLLAWGESCAQDTASGRWLVEIQVLDAHNHWVFLDETFATEAEALAMAIALHRMPE